MKVSKSLIESCKKSDENANKHLYNASIPYVYSIVSRYIREEAEIKDLIQEIFAKTFSKINTFDRDKGEFKYWIRRIAVNECLMYLRTKSKLEIISISNSFDSIDTDNRSNSELTREDISGMLKKMPKKYKIVFMAYIIDDLSHKEIAKLLNITPETSRSQLNRAKKWVKQNIFNNNKYKAYGFF